MLIKNNTYLAEVQTKENATKIYNDSKETTGLLQNQNASDLFKGLQYVSSNDRWVVEFLTRLPKL